MKRDSRLAALSRDHHHALVLAREASRGIDGAVLRDRFDAEIAPHFAIEEELLLPPLLRAGGEALVARTLEDHRGLRALLAAILEGASSAPFGQRLAEHVRFEERELFPECEARLPSDVLDQVAARCTG